MSLVERRPRPAPAAAVIRRSGPRMAVAAFLAGLWGCTEAEAPAAPANFSRPQQVAFACFQEGRNETAQDEIEARPLADCTDPRERDSADDPILHALVTQTETGEVAAVDLARSRVVDSREDIPGYTFVDVGDLPVAIVVPPQAARYTYIANYTGEIGAFQTTAFRPVRDRAFRARVQPAIALPGLARPSDMVLAPAEDALFVAARNTGELFVIPICRDAQAGCEPGHLLDPIPVPLSSGAAVQQPEQGPEGEPYAVIGDSDGDDLAEPRLRCEETRRFVFGEDPSWPADPATGAQAQASDAGTDAQAQASDAGTDAGPDAGTGGGEVQPEPVALAIDSACDGAGACAPRLLVADAAMPVIHRFAIEGASLSARSPWVTGVPTRALAVTPDVPISPDNTAQTHYVYAIDDRNGTVLVLQDGALLPVNPDPEAQVDRLSFGVVPPGSRALDLEVLVRGTASPSLACDLADDDGAGEPARLRGVFLSVALNDGSVVIYDIDDYDVRDGQAAGGLCRRCPFAVKRHRPRIGVELADANFGAVIGPVINPDPYYQVTDRTLTVQTNGRSRDPRLPELACMACPESMVPAFLDPARRASLESGGGPDGEAGSNLLCGDGEARVCVVADPFLASGEAWIAEYEGDLPGTQGTGIFDTAADVLTVIGGVPDLCARGVLGEDALPGAGDQLVLLSAPSEEAQAQWADQGPDVETACGVLHNALRSGERAAAFEITRAYPRSLELDANNLTGAVDDRTVRAELPQDLSEVRRCYSPDSPITFEIRSRESFIVEGTAVGFKHRVRAGDNGRCVEDETAERRRAGRLFIGASAADPRPFNNGRVALSLVRREQPVSPSQPPFLVLTVVNPGRPLAYPAGSGISSGVLVQELRYSPQDERLYMVDPHVRGLFSLELADFTLDAQSFN